MPACGIYVVVWPRESCVVWRVEGWRDAVGAWRGVGFDEEGCV